MACSLWEDHLPKPRLKKDGEKEEMKLRRWEDPKLVVQERF
jgi:hypothetical protein